MQNAIASTTASPGYSFRARVPSSAATALAVALGYSICFLIGSHLKPATSPISFLWPPNAFLLGVLLLTSPRRWPLLLISVLPVQLAIQVPTGVPVVTSLSWYSSNCAEALIGAALIRRFATVDE